MKNYIELTESFTGACEAALSPLKNLRSACDDMIDSDELRHEGKFKYNDLRIQINKFEMLIKSYIK